MMAFSSSGVLPVISSTSTPRSRKILAAWGSILSEMRTFGMMMPFMIRGEVVLPRRREPRLGPRLRGDTRRSGGDGDRGVGPVEPRPERLDIGGVDSRA